MNREKLEKFLLENQDKIVGIKIDDDYYNIDYILDYNSDEDNEPFIYIDDEGICLTMSDLLGMDKLEFYKRTKIEF